MNPRLVVLCYHGLSDTWPDDTAVTPADFGAQIEFFLGRGYRATTFTDALTNLPAPRTLVVTFDDANESVLRLGAPLLERLGVPATIFVPTDYPDSGRLMSWGGIDRWLGGPHEPELECLGWESLRELAAAGWEIGSHTAGHPLLTEVDDATLARELAESKRACECEIGSPCYSLAYPYGIADNRIVRAARVAGYAVAATVPITPVTALPLRWPRVGVYRGESARRVMLRAQRRMFGAALPFRRP
ncbi:MAG TPA: polysaccharide deacetylase family protein [Solirubrobacterales bacterium]|nr:polysaccharide deacetylase family protein [Solirubrobacterales bacterium]